MLICHTAIENTVIKYYFELSWSKSNNLVVCTMLSVNNNIKTCIIQALKVHSNHKKL